MGSTHPLLALLGRSLDDEGLRQFFAERGKAPRASREGYASFKPLGIELLLSGRPKVVSTVFIFLRPVASYTPYQGRLPCGLGRTWDRDRVRRRLGEPIRSGGPKFDQRGTMIDTIQPWDLYLRIDYTIRTAFDHDDGRLADVVLATLEGTPGLSPE